MCCIVYAVRTRNSSHKRSRHHFHAAILHEVQNLMIKFFKTSEIMEKANMHTYSIVCTPYTQIAYIMSRSLMSLFTNVHGNNIPLCPKQQLKVQNASSSKRKFRVNTHTSVTELLKVAATGMNARPFARVSVYVCVCVCVCV